MEKNKPGLRHLPSYDKNNLEDCLYRSKHHILNYIDNIPEIKKNLLYMSIDGKIGNEFMRSCSWKLFLKTLSSDKNTTLKTWLEETFNQRKNFKKKVQEVLTISKFKGRLFVNIREYYDDNGTMKPGKKGITLSKECWKRICENISDINEAIDNMS